MYIRPPSALWRIELSDLVTRLGVVRERLVAVRKALGHVDRATVFRAQFDFDVLQDKSGFRAAGPR